MNIRQTLTIIQQLADKDGTSQPFLCGGVPRDKVLNRLENIDDLDITTGDDSIHTLSRACGTQFMMLGGVYKKLADNHAQITFQDGKKIDFSTNYNAPKVKELLQKGGLKNPSSMQLELYSRDFTVNCLLMDMSLEKITDPTGLGINDIQKKRLRTPLPAKYTLGDDNKRVVRILYLAAKLQFDVDEEIINWVKANPTSISNVKPKYLSDKLQQAVNYDEKRTVDLINKMGLWQHVPALPALIPYMGRGLVNR